MSAFGKSRHSLHQANFSINNTDSQAAISPLAGHPQAMLTEIYIEALDEELLDLIEAAFLKGLIDGETQELAYTWLEVNHPCEQ